MIKEQIFNTVHAAIARETVHATIIRGGHNTVGAAVEATDQIIALFREEIEKLSVINDETVNSFVGDFGWSCDTLAKREDLKCQYLEVARSQLRHCKDALLRAIQ